MYIFFKINFEITLTYRIFQSIESFKDKQVIKVLTGIRHCGKSVLMEQFMQSLLERGVSERHYSRII